MLKTLRFTQTAIALTTATTILATAGVGRAIVVFNSASANYARYGQYSGVARLQIRTTSGNNETCTGSLLRGGLYILTAAHCVSDRRGNRNAARTRVRFVERPTTFTIPNNGYFIFPGWRGNFYNGNDIALLRLPRIVRGVEQYNIYRGSGEVGKVFTKVGYGYIGTGNLGDRRDLFGTGKLVGLNRFDGRGENFVVAGNPLPGRQLLLDFDNGSRSNNFFIGSDLGLGNREINTAPGDSGGPAFINGQIAGITSYGQRFDVTDIDAVLNSSFGEYSSETRVSFYQNYIRKVLRGSYRPSALAPATGTSTATAKAPGLSANSSASLAADSPSESSVAVPESSSPLAMLLGVLGIAGLIKLRNRGR